jgi:hypothetical protein
MDSPKEAIMRKVCKQEASIAIRPTPSFNPTTTGRSLAENRSIRKKKK